MCQELYTSSTQRSTNFYNFGHLLKQYTRPGRSETIKSVLTSISRGQRGRETVLKERHQPIVYVVVVVAGGDHMCWYTEQLRCRRVCIRIIPTKFSTTRGRPREQSATGVLIPNKNYSNPDWRLAAHLHADGPLWGVDRPRGRRLRFASASSGPLILIRSHNHRDAPVPRFFFTPFLYRSSFFCTLVRKTNEPPTTMSRKTEKMEDCTWQ